MNVTDPELLMKERRPAIIVKMNQRRDQNEKKGIKPGKNSSYFW
jgi:hypothetical protein